MENGVREKRVRRPVVARFPYRMRAALQPGDLLLVEHPADVFHTFKLEKKLTSDVKTLRKSSRDLWSRNGSSELHSLHQWGLQILGTSRDMWDVGQYIGVAPDHKDYPRKKRSDDNLETELDTEMGTDIPFDDLLAIEHDKALEDREDRLVQDILAALTPTIEGNVRQTVKDFVRQLDTN